MRRCEMLLNIMENCRCIFLSMECAFVEKINFVFEIKQLTWRDVSLENIREVNRINNQQSGVY